MLNQEEWEELAAEELVAKTKWMDATNLQLWFGEKNVSLLEQVFKHFDKCDICEMEHFAEKLQRYCSMSKEEAVQQISTRVLINYKERTFESEKYKLQLYDIHDRAKQLQQAICEQNKEFVLATKGFKGLIARLKFLFGKE